MRGAAKRLGKQVTKAMLQDPAFTAESQQQGLAVPNLFPNSAQYWQGIGHDVFAMVRQLGTPTLFKTISAAEYHWPILLRALKRLSRSGGQVEQREGEAEVRGMPQDKEVAPEVQEEIDEVLKQSGVPKEERFKLIREDPVVCAMYFREVVEELRRWLCKGKGRGPMGKYHVKDYLFRIEFQVCLCNNEKILLCFVTCFPLC